MNVSEFLKTIGKDAPAPVYLFCPDKAPRAREATFEPLLAQRAVDSMVAQCVDPGLRDLIYSSYHADETPAGEVVSVARTYPFLSERRVVVVRGVERYESEAQGKPLFEYLASPCDTTILLLVANQIDRRLKLFKACEKGAIVVGCPELRENEAVAWARDEIEQRGKRIEPGALRLLIKRTGTTLGDVNNAIELVCGYVGNADAIVESDVDAACADVAEEKVWTMTDAIGESDTTKALESLRAIIDLGKNEFEILGSINWLLKSAYLVATNNSQLPEFTARKCRPLAEKLGRQKLRDAFSLCMKAEIMLRSTGVDSALALELLVLKLAYKPERSALPKARSSSA
jgi:DNA polymerase-3 subunit delta